MTGLSGVFKRFYPKIMGITTSSLTSSFTLVLVLFPQISFCQMSLKKGFWSPYIY